MEINTISTTIQPKNYECSIVELINEKGGTDFIEIEKKNLTAPEVLIYNSFVNTFAEISQTRIVNTVNVFCLTRMTSDIIIENTIEIDYAGLSTAAKNKIDSFYTMVKSKNQQ